MEVSWDAELFKAVESYVANGPEMTISNQVNNWYSNQ